MTGHVTTLIAPVAAGSGVALGVGVVIWDGFRNRITGWANRSWRNLKYEAHSRYLTNPSSRRLFAAHAVALTTVQRRVVDEMTKRGVAFVQQDELGIPPEHWTRLRALVEQFATSEKVREGIRRFPEQFARGKMVSDGYMVKLYPDGPTLAADHPLLGAGLDSSMLGVVNSYLGLWAKLIYTDVWHGIPIDLGRRIGSQNWHRDPEDKTLVKIYMYFSDVDATAGPLEYVPGSAVGGPYGQVRAWKPGGARYPGPGELEQLLPTAERVSCTGTPGTIVFCDTGGFHRGGVATQKPRIAATWTFVRPASMKVTSHRRFQVDHSAAQPGFSVPARYALS